jgi:hypothetical protein
VLHVIILICSPNYGLVLDRAPPSILTPATLREKTNCMVELHEHVDNYCDRSRENETSSSFVLLIYVCQLAIQQLDPSNLLDRI